VGRKIQVEGVVQRIPIQHHVWIAHEVDPGGFFWVKDFEVRPDPEGRFRRHVSEGGSPEEFSILLVLTTQLGHKQFTDWIKEAGSHASLRTLSYSTNSIESRLPSIPTSDSRGSGSTSTPCSF
jgi:hypothetical protein